jgi:hypothetical protein
MHDFAKHPNKLYRMASFAALGRTFAPWRDTNAALKSHLSHFMHNLPKPPPPKGASALRAHRTVSPGLAANLLAQVSQLETFQ